jgi:hypothetical protein
MSNTDLDYSPLDMLIVQYQEWIKEQNLPLVSADEHELEKLNDYQRTWLTSFREQWELAADQEQALLQAHQADEQALSDDRNAHVPEPFRAILNDFWQKAKP